MLTENEALQRQLAEQRQRFEALTSALAQPGHTRLIPRILVDVDCPFGHDETT
jgi:hypothetical protein